MRIVFGCRSWLRRASLAMKENVAEVVGRVGIATLGGKAVPQHGLRYVLHAETQIVHGPMLVAAKG